MEPLLSMSSTLHCADDGASDGWPPPPRFPASSSSFYDAHCPVSDLLSAELEHAPQPGYLTRLRDGSLDAAPRREAICWILKVHAFYRFRPMTAFLAVNYLDRFLSLRALPKGLGWPWQLLSVACLSVAAKMEETDAPPLFDLQVMEPRFLFDPRTVGRMELLLMAALCWRMRPVTPFDFVSHFAGLLPLAGPRDLQEQKLFSRASELILGAQRVVEFLECRPSAIAAAAVLCAAGSGEDDISLLQDVVSKDAVEGCRRLMEEYLLDTCPSPGLAKAAPAGLEPPAVPQSPVGVLDAAACASCETQELGAKPDTGAGAAGPFAKRRRLLVSSTESSDSSVVGGDGP